MMDYEKEDIARRADVVDEWKNPFGTMDKYALKNARKNLREVLRDMNIRIGQLEAEEREAFFKDQY